MWDSLRSISATGELEGRNSTYSKYGQFEDNNNIRRSSSSSSSSGSSGVRLYSHESRHACVWALHPFESDRQTALASVSSDGSFRCAYTSSVSGSGSYSNSNSSGSGRKMLGYNAGYHNNNANNYNGTQYSPPVSGIDRWVVQGFKILSVKDDKRDEMNGSTGVKAGDTHSLSDAGTSTSPSPSQSHSSSKWCGPSAVVYVSSRHTLNTVSDQPDLTQTASALHTVDSTPFITSHREEQEHEESCNTDIRLFAYGGAAGLLRIHTMDIRGEILK